MVPPRTPRQQTVTVDGLLVGDPELTNAKVYHVFLIRREGARRLARGQAEKFNWEASADRMLAIHHDVLRSLTGRAG